MILLTVGTERFSFHRLVEALDSLAAPGAPLDPKATGRALFAQIGSCRSLPRHVPYERIVPFERMRGLIEGAELVITHAGAGSTLLCIELGHKPIAVPRRHAHGEHVDDHQVLFAERLHAAGHVHLLADPKGLRGAIEAAMSQNQPRAGLARGGDLSAHIERVITRWEERR